MENPTMAHVARQKAAAYIRVSQERAARNGYGLGAQETDVTRYTAYKDLDLVDTYREEGVSGYKKERPALDRLLADARAGRFQIVIFPSIDRAGRSVSDVIEIDQALRVVGVATVFLREGVDTSTATGQLFRNIMASIAEFEGRMIYERLAKGKARKAAEGGYIGGWLPYGYRRGEDGNVAEIPEQVKTLRRIFTWAAEGKSLRWMCDQLEETGVPTQKGRRWRAATIQRILTNRFYSGRIKTRVRDDKNGVSARRMSC